MRVTTHAGNRYAQRCGYFDVFEADKILLERLEHAIELTVSAAKELYPVSRDKHVNKKATRFLEFYEPNLKEHVLAIVVEDAVVTVFTQEIHLIGGRRKISRKEWQDYDRCHRLYSGEGSGSTGLPD